MGDFALFVGGASNRGLGASSVILIVGSLCLALKGRSAVGELSIGLIMSQTGSVGLAGSEQDDIGLSSTSVELLSHS